jgi:predicted flap endonuclease-1-like 5' DNA nuclease
MAYKIDEIEGIGPAYREKLAGAGIKTTDDLLDKCADAKGRKATADSSGLSEKHLLNWSNKADLMRISGIGPQFSELLEAAGVDTVKELRHRNAENLATKMGEVNEQKKLARTSPATSVVEGWIADAKKTDPKITY